MTRHLDLSRVRFGRGQHREKDDPTGDRDLCIMEAVAYVAGEDWSDAPACVDPEISALLRVWHDALSDSDRDRLLPAARWVPLLVGSRRERDPDEPRIGLAVQYTLAARWLRAVGLDEEAARMVPGATKDTWRWVSRVARSLWADTEAPTPEARRAEEEILRREGPEFWRRYVEVVVTDSGLKAAWTVDTSLARLYTDPDDELLIIARCCAWVALRRALYAEPDRASDPLLRSPLAATVALCQRDLLDLVAARCAPSRSAE